MLITRSPASRRDTTILRLVVTTNTPRVLKEAGCKKRKAAPYHKLEQDDRPGVETAPFSSPDAFAPIHRLAVDWVEPLPSLG